MKNKHVAQSIRQRLIDSVLRGTQMRQLINKNKFLKMKVKAKSQFPYFDYSEPNESALARTFILVWVSE